MGTVAMGEQESIHDTATRPPGAGARLRAWRSRAHGLVALAALAALGYGLVGLADMGPPDTGIETLAGEGGDTLLLEYEIIKRDSEFRTPRYQLILSRQPFQLDVVHRVIQPDIGSPQIVPLHWRLILVDPGGRVTHRKFRITARELHGVLVPLFKTGSLQRVMKLLNTEPGLRDFFQKSP